MKRVIKRSTVCSFILATMILLFGGCYRPESEYLVAGGSDRVAQMWRTAKVGTNFKEWCKHNEIRPDAEVPIAFPSDPAPVLRKIQHMWHAYYPKDIRDFAAAVKTPADWREMVFEWHGEHVKWQKKLGAKDAEIEWSVWFVDEKLRRTLPLDGSYRVAFFLLYRNNVDFSPHCWTMRIMVGPGGKIVAKHYSSQKYWPRKLRAIKRMGTYF